MPLAVSPDMAFHQVTPTSLTPSRPAPAVPVGYGSPYVVGTSSPSGSTYASSYSGIGGSPNRDTDSVSSTTVVRSGVVSVKEDGLVSWLWRPKFLVLKEQILAIHKNSDVSKPASFSACNSAWLALRPLCCFPRRCWTWVC